MTIITAGFEKFEIREWGGVGQGSLDVIKCNFSKSGFLTSHAQIKYFRHHVKLKSGQGHPRSSSAIFQKVDF